MPENALFIERDTALRLQIVSDVRPGGDLVMQRGYARKAAFEPRHRARERIAQPGNELNQRQVAIADPPSDQIAVAPRVALDDPFEIAELLRNAVGDKIGGTAARFLPLVLVIEGRGDRVMRIVGFIDDIGDRQLQLMRPEPSRLVARREPVTPPKIEEDVRGLRDQYLAILEKRRGKRAMPRSRPLPLPLHPPAPTPPARAVPAFEPGPLPGET